ncbi:MAG TPA: hypothetical protein VER04_17455 [Polyangiaceae bacterium]|nr:hypothetical protein [Polyangiaceae bacterium]
MSKRAILGAGALIVGTVGGCTHNTKMVSGVPLEVQRGYCIGDTQFKQGGKPLNRDSVMAHLSKNSHARPHIESGGNLAIGSIITALLGTTGIILGAAGKRGDIKMDDGVSTALLAGGIGLGVASWPLCIAADGQYAAGAAAYNAHLPRGTDDEEEDTSE